MSFKQSINSFISNFRSTQDSVFKIKTTNAVSVFKILPKLLKYNCISRYCVKDNFIYVYKTIESSRLTTAFIPKHRSNVSYFELQSLMYKHPTVVYIVSTTVGILDNDEIIKLKIGGNLLFIIKYKNTI